MHFPAAANFILTDNPSVYDWLFIQAAQVDYELGSLTTGTHDLTAYFNINDDGVFGGSGYYSRPNDLVNGFQVPAQFTVQWKTTGSQPRACSAGTRRTMYETHDLPSELIATYGRNPAGGAAARQAPTTAPAACANVDRHTSFSPYSPPAHRIIIRSGASRSGGMRCE